MEKFAVLLHAADQKKIKALKTASRGFINMSSATRLCTSKKKADNINLTKRKNVEHIMIDHSSVPQHIAEAYINEPELVGKNFYTVNSPIQIAGAKNLSSWKELQETIAA